MKITSSYYRTKEALVVLIEHAVFADLNFETAHMISLELNELMRGIDENTRGELIDIAVRFSNWLDDGDIRERDKKFAKQTTDALLEWVKINKD